jgi:hypothetical protein
LIDPRVLCSGVAALDLPEVNRLLCPRRGCAQEGCDEETFDALNHGGIMP